MFRKKIQFGKFLVKIVLRRSPSVVLTMIRGAASWIRFPRKSGDRIDPMRGTGGLLLRSRSNMRRVMIFKIGSERPREVSTKTFQVELPGHRKLCRSGRVTSHRRQSQAGRCGSCAAPWRAPTPRQE